MMAAPTSPAQMEEPARSLPVVGEYDVVALTGEDILSLARFDDSIGINAWPMELHQDGRIDWGFHRDERRAYNDLPWRMLVPRGIDNLLAAGCGGSSGDTPQASACG